MKTIAGALALTCTLLSAGQEPAKASDELTARIDAIRVKAELPALAGALVTREGLQGVWVTGLRQKGGDEPVTPDDQWHIGSCTKSMTATLLALLVKRGDLTWEVPLGDALPELAGGMNERFREVPLVQLVCHRAGLTDGALMEHFQEWRTSKAPVMEQREELCRLALAAAPAHEPGSTFEYANTGFVIAGHVAEVATGKPWEELIRTLLFSPLGMTSAGFGAPGVPDADDQPRGHFPGGGPVEPGPMADNPSIVGPAGTVHATLGDWAKYVQLHLKGVGEDVKLGEITLTVDDFAVLHEAFDGPGQSYGFGWVHETRPWAGGDGTALWHNGSNTMWYALTWLGLENGVAGLAVTNVFTPAAQGATDEVVGLLVKEWERRAVPAPK